MAEFNEPNLHLVGAGDRRALDRWTATSCARDEVARENRLAAVNPDAQYTMSPTDLRWVFAVRVHREMQGPILTPERRQKLLTLSTRLGLRPFDANVIISLVQDRLRRGEGLESIEDSLQLVPERENRPRTLDASRWIAAVSCALVGTVFMIWWLTA